MGIQACVEHQAHYCDIAAEAQYIQRSMFEFHEAAKERGVRIVHSCGLDSVPSEVMTLMAAHRMATEHGSALGEVTYVCEDSTHPPPASPVEYHLAHFPLSIGPVLLSVPV